MQSSIGTETKVGRVRQGPAHLQALQGGHVQARNTWGVHITHGAELFCASPLSDCQGCTGLGLRNQLVLGDASVAPAGGFFARRHSGGNAAPVLGMQVRASGQAGGPAVTQLDLVDRSKLVGVAVTSPPPVTSRVNVHLASATYMARCVTPMSLNTRHERAGRARSCA
jgi:hypothetical protein